MNIQEATKLAMKNGKSIHRKSEFDVLRKPGKIWNFCPQTVMDM
ncbi:hypothetical protein ACRS32_01295 [Staphylococcus epidermidis]